MKSIAGIIVTALAIIFISAAAGAMDFHGVSIKSDIDAAGKNRIINVVIDENELLDSYDFWKGNGLRREMTETFFSLASLFNGSSVCSQFCESGVARSWQDMRSRSCTELAGSDGCRN
jgi:hypothetical protein